MQPTPHHSLCRWLRITTTHTWPVALAEANYTTQGIVALVEAIYFPTGPGLLAEAMYTTPGPVLLVKYKLSPWVRVLGKHAVTVNTVVKLEGCSRNFKYCPPHHLIP